MAHRRAAVAAAALRRRSPGEAGLAGPRPGGRGRPGADGILGGAQRARRGLRHAPDDLLSRITASGAAGDAPTFMAFLSEAIGGDAAFQAFSRARDGLLPDTLDRGARGFLPLRP